MVVVVVVVIGGYLIVYLHIYLNIQHNMQLVIPVCTYLSSIVILCCSSTAPNHRATGQTTLTTASWGAGCLRWQRVRWGGDDGSSAIGDDDDATWRSPIYDRRWWWKMIDDREVKCIDINTFCPSPRLPRYVLFIIDNLISGLHVIRYK